MTLPGRLAAAALFAATATQPCLAQVAPKAVATVPAGQRGSAMEAMVFAQAYSPSKLRREAELRILRESFVKSLEKEPSTAAMLKAFPALGPEMVKALESQIDLYIRDFDVRFFPRAAEIARTGFSREDLIALTAFYQSPLGLKILRAATENVDGTEIAERSLKGEKVDEGVADRQLVQSGWAILGALSPDERKLMLEFASSPLGQRFEAVRPRFSALQREIINSPSPTFKAASEKALEQAVQRVTGIDLQSGK